MENIINYYYNITIENIIKQNDNLYFSSNGNKYCFRIFSNNINLIKDIYNLNNYLSTFILIDKIILNKYNEILTEYNNNLYILTLINNKTSIEDLIYNNKVLPTISNLSNIKVPETKSLERNNWEILWGNMIDYYEMQIGQNEKKYPLIRESLDYYIGMAENAISYLVNTKKEVKKENSDNMVLAHNNLNHSLFDPLNIIFDHKARDLAEYIKLSFFNNNKDIFKELDEYFFYNRYSLYGIRVLYARVLYPSYYFKLYDKILRGENEEKELTPIISRINEYEDYLYNLSLYLNKYYDIPSVDWLKKTRY